MAILRSIVPIPVGLARQLEVKPAKRRDIIKDLQVHVTWMNQQSIDLRGTSTTLKTESNVNMHRLLASTFSAALLLGVTLGTLGDTPAYQACPLLRSYYPTPSINKNSDEVKSFTKKFTSLFDQLVEAGGSDDFGKIAPNTTSFSVVLFSGSEDAEADPVFFEYHHPTSGAPKDSQLDSNTVFPLGTLSQLFTVYTWLVEVGDDQWGASITQFLPGLKSTASDGLSVTWDDITIGALASQMSGLARDCRSPISATFRNTF